jgi:diadenosine tetraphosphate (Ap4A) HIT family hydrolase
MAFQLDGRLAADTVSVLVCDGVDIRLMRDARYWWAVLVPQIDGAQEWQDLPKAESDALHHVSLRVANALRDLAQADKMNIAALGNMVRQLHVHVVARHEGDAAWPGPVWGVGAAQSYTDEALAARCDALRDALSLA